LLDLVTLAYEAALEPNLWPQVAAGASRAFEAPHVMLGVADGRGNMAIRAEPLGWGKVDLSPFPTLETNPGLAFAALTPPTTVALRDRVISDSDLERSQLYQELMRPFALWHAAVMNVHRGGGVLAPMSFMRTRNERPFDDGDLAALRALAPHFNRALRVTMRLREMEAQASALAETGDRALTALLLTDAYGRIAQANGLARAILEESDGLMIRDGELRAARSDDNARLVRLILEAAGGVNGCTFICKSGVMQVARPSSSFACPRCLPDVQRRGAIWPFACRLRLVSRPGARIRGRRRFVCAPLWLHRARGGSRGAACARPLPERSRRRARDDREHSPHPHPPRLREDRRRAAGRSRSAPHERTGRSG
jgi:hypothetical protein